MTARAFANGRDADDARQFLTFNLAGEEYGVGILTVKEIRGWSAVTVIPHSAPWLLGVINLRGVVVPIIDLRIRFGLGDAAYNDTTVVIIINVDARLAGIVVDGVSDVITLAGHEIKAPPSLGNQADTSHIIGFGIHDQRMRILVDVERLLAGADIGDLPAMNQTKERM
jgi:purine-binding chemotaxis protein CheW